MASKTQMHFLKNNADISPDRARQNITTLDHPDINPIDILAKSGFLNMKTAKTSANANSY